MTCLTLVWIIITNRNHNLWTGLSFMTNDLIKTIMIKWMKIMMTTTLLTLQCGKYILTRMTDMTTAACYPTREVHHPSHSANNPTTSQDSETPNRVGFLGSKTCSIFLAHLPFESTTSPTWTMPKQAVSLDRKSCFCSCGFCQTILHLQKLAGSASVGTIIIILLAAGI